MPGHRGIVLGVVAVLSLGAASSPATRRAATTTSSPATSRPTTTRKSPSDAAKAAIRSAVTALAKEYADYQRGVAKSQLRTACNYFKDHPSPDVTPDALAAAIATTGAGDPRLAAYVKWQLLSGLPDQLEKDSPAAKDLLLAYRASPGPAP